MSVTVGQRYNLTATGESERAECFHPNLGGAGYATTHTWQVINNSASQATIRPQGSLVTDHDPLADDAWSDLGAADIDIPAGEAALITLSDQPLKRTRLNVVTLADESLDVIYVAEVP